MITKTRVVHLVIQAHDLHTEALMGVPMEVRMVAQAAPVPVLAPAQQVLMVVQEPHKSAVTHMEALRTTTIHMEVTTATVLMEVVITTALMVQVHLMDHPPQLMPTQQPFLMVMLPQS